MTRSATPILIGLLLLAGCSGGGTASAPVVPDCPEGDFCDVSADLAATLSEAGLDGTGTVSTTPGSLPTQTPTPIADLPTSGSLLYEGQIALQVSENNTAGEVVLGNTDFDVAFTNTGGTFAGTASGFVGQTSGRYTGTLALTDGVLVQGGDAFRTAVEQRFGATEDLDDGQQQPQDLVGIISDVSGQLTSSSANQTTFDGGFVGAFSGPNADIVGIATGTTLSDTAPGQFVGVIVAVD